MTEYTVTVTGATGKTGRQVVAEARARGWRVRPAARSRLEQDDRAAERTLLSLPSRFAIARPTWFLDNFTEGSFAAVTAAGELRLPAGEGSIPFVDVRDVAAVAEAALAPDGPEGYCPRPGRRP